ncbi:hypothetical protein GMRT_10863 [Giardia muris]|uniref:Transcriptional adapter 2-alpha/beta-like domain-containing protein n=1 Tax=Giardia muris TaxID=5742 RepID=A0A4Z1T4W0_GIAMU|nr:hypothetical protein GMRT_10863 [Giardia muris]|eukprot:TNJ27559.1 hypothetical protein GMRT_10863 [Giardia muris]
MNWPAEALSGARALDGPPTAAEDTVGDDLCSFCERRFDPYTLKMQCHICKDFSLCLDCYIARTEYKTHVSAHSMYPRVLFSAPAWPDGWSLADDLALLEAIEMLGMGSWEAIKKFLRRPAAEPVETLILHFNVLFADDGILGRHTLETIKTPEDEARLLAQLPDLGVLEQYQERVRKVYADTHLDTPEDEYPSDAVMTTTIWESRTVSPESYAQVMSELPNDFVAYCQDFLGRLDTLDLGFMRSDTVRKYPHGAEIKELPSSVGEGDGKVFIAGSWPLRGDYNVEYLNKAEFPLMYMRLNYGRETRVSMQLKVRTLQAYVLRLQERERRKLFVFQSSLHRPDFRVDDVCIKADEKVIRLRNRTDEFSLPLTLEMYYPNDVSISRFEQEHSWLIRGFDTRLELRQFARRHLDELGLRLHIHNCQIARLLGIRSVRQLGDVDSFLRMPQIYIQKYKADQSFRKRFPAFVLNLGGDGKAKESHFFEIPGHRQLLTARICMARYLQQQCVLTLQVDAQVSSERQFCGEPPPGGYGLTSIWRTPRQEGLFRPEDEPLTHTTILARLGEFYAEREAYAGILGRATFPRVTVRVLRCVCALHAVSTPALTPVYFSRAICGCPMVLQLFIVNVLSVLAAITYQNCLVQTIFHGGESPLLALAPGGEDGVEASLLRQKLQRLANARPNPANTMYISIHALYSAFCRLVPDLAAVVIEFAGRGQDETAKDETGEHAYFHTLMQWFGHVLSNYTHFANPEQYSPLETSNYTLIGGAQSSMRNTLGNALKPDLEVDQLIGELARPDIWIGEDEAEAEHAYISVMQARLYSAGPILLDALRTYRALLRNDLGFDQFQSSQYLGNVTLLTNRAERFALNTVQIFTNISFTIQYVFTSPLIAHIVNAFMPSVLLAYGLRSPCVESLIRALSGLKRYEFLPGMLGSLSSADIAETPAIHDPASVERLSCLPILGEGTVDVQLRQTILFSSFGTQLAHGSVPHRLRLFGSQQGQGQQISCMLDGAPTGKDRQPSLFFGSYFRMSPRIPAELCTVTQLLALQHLTEIAEADPIYNKATLRMKRAPNNYNAISASELLRTDALLAKLSPAEYREIRIRLCLQEKKVLFHTMQEYSKIMLFKVMSNLADIISERLDRLAVRNKEVLRKQTSTHQELRPRGGQQRGGGQASENVMEIFGQADISALISEFDARTVDDHMILNRSIACDIKRCFHEPVTKVPALADKVAKNGLSPEHFLIIDPKEYLFGPSMIQTTSMDPEYGRPSIVPLNMRSRPLRPIKMRFTPSLSENGEMMTVNEFCSRYISRGDVILMAVADIDFETYIFAKELFVASGFVITRTIFSAFSCRPNVCEAMAMLVLAAVNNRDAYATVPDINRMNQEKVECAPEWCHCTPYHLFIQHIPEPSPEREVTIPVDIQLCYNTRTLLHLTELLIPRHFFKTDLQPIQSLNVPTTLLQRAEEVIDSDSLTKLYNSIKSIYTQSHFSREFRMASTVGHGEVYPRRPDRQTQDTGVQTTLSYWSEYRKDVDRGRRSHSQRGSATALPMQRRHDSPSFSSRTHTHPHSSSTTTTVSPSTQLQPSVPVVPLSSSGPSTALPTPLSININPYPSDRSWVGRIPVAGRSIAGEQSLPHPDAILGDAPPTIAPPGDSTYLPLQLLPPGPNSGDFTPYSASTGALPEGQGNHGYSGQ